MAVTSNQFRPPTGTPTGTATPRASSDPANPYNGVSSTPQGLLQWMTWEKQHNPSYQIADGFHQDQSGNVVEDQPGFLLSHPWVIPLLGVAAGTAGAAVGAGESAGGAASTLGPSTAANISATSAATAAPASIAASTAAPVAAASTASWLAPVIGGVAGAAGNIIGSAIQANASGNAAAINAKSVQDALNFEKQAYGTTLTNLAPYIQSGATATDKMAQLLGLPARYNSTAPASGPPPTGQPIPGAPTFTPTPGSNPGQQTSIAGVAPPLAAGTPVPNQYRLNPTSTPTSTGGPQPVTLRAPDGSVQQVPPGQVNYWLGKGATLVGAAA